MYTTIEIDEIEFEVGFDYHPAEEMVMYYSDGSGYPGCTAGIDGIYDLKHNGEDWSDFIDDYAEIIEAKIWDRLNEETYY